MLYIEVQTIYQYFVLFAMPVFKKKKFSPNFFFFFCFYFLAMSLDGLEALAPIVGSQDGLKLAASLFQFVRKRYGLEKSRLSGAELGHVVSSLGVKDAAAAAKLADAVWLLEEQVIRGSFASVEEVGALVVGKVSNPVAAAGEKQRRWK